MAKVSTFMIGLVLVGLLIYSSSNFIAEGAQNYNVAYDNTTFSSLNRLSELNTYANDTKEDLDDLASQQGVLDVIGDFIGRAFNTVKTIVLSFDAFFKISSSSVGFLGLDEVYNNALSTMVVILIFVGVLLSALMKWYL